MGSNPETLALIHHKVNEVIADARPPGVDEKWINSTTAANRLHALELLRWHEFGKERCQADIEKALEVMRHPAGG